MDAYEALVRPVLFRIDPERAHNIALEVVRHGLAPASPSISSPVTLFDVEFPNRVGLAAGFDKNGEGVDFWGDLGFGFVEIGTVTRHGQPGNPRPRMFRYPEARCLVNRLGFNNEGADAVARRLERSSPSIPLGVNIGKSKVTELEDAAADYAYSFRRLKDFAAYVVVNVSSPNTPGLRTLQDRPALTAILESLRAIDDAKPLFVKVAPDLEMAALDDVARVVADCRITGVVATNTTLSRPPFEPPTAWEAGGLSGALLRPKADEALRHLKLACPQGTLFIGVGGVISGHDAVVKRMLGADLVQLYTGLVFRGPGLVAECAKALAECG